MAMLKAIRQAPRRQQAPRNDIVTTAADREASPPMRLFGQVGSWRRFGPVGPMGEARL
jgi:hypothetical protein